MIPGIMAGGVNGVATETDPHFANVVSLLPMTTAGTSFPDAKSVSWTAAGGATVNSGEALFGLNTATFDGTGDFLFAADDPNWTLDTDYTGEVFVRPDATASIRAIVSTRPSGLSRGFIFFMNASGVLQFIMYDASTAIILNLTGSTTLSTMALQHCAFTIEGTTGRIFLGGNLEASGTISGTPSDSTGSLIYGRDATTAARDWDGRMGQGRLTRGVARYTASFTPPSGPFPNL